MNKALKLISIEKLVDELNIPKDELTIKILNNNRFRLIDLKIDAQEKRFKLQKAEHDKAMAELYTELHREESVFLRDEKNDQTVNNYCIQMEPGEYAINSVYYLIFPEHPFIRTCYLELILNEMLAQAQRNNWKYVRDTANSKIVFVKDDIHE